MEASTSLSPGPKVSSRPPSVEATLEPVGGTSGIIHFVPGTDSAAHRGDYGNGYYVLNLRLVDEGEVVWGTVEAVRIIAGEVSRALFALTEDVNRGGLALTVVNGLDNPIEVTLDGDESIPQGRTMQVTATTSESVDGYSWYLQGTPIGVGAPSIVVGEGLDVGHYWLSLVVTKGSVLGSGAWKFTVYESVDPILNVDTSLPWAESDLHAYSPDYSDRIAQGFIPGMTGELARVEVYVYSDNADPQPVEFEIHTADEDGKPTGTILAAGAGIIPGGPGTNTGWDQWATLTLPEPRPVLTAGERYAVVIVHNVIITSANATPAFGEVYTNYFPYPGQWFATNGNPDLLIRTYVLP